MMKKTPGIKILFLDILTDNIALRASLHKKVYRGKSYSEVMRRAVGIGLNEWTHYYGSENNFPHNLSQFDGIIIGGSLEDPVRGKEKVWMKHIYQLIRHAVKKEIPILGICGGLQFTARAFGKEVSYNPKGRELGDSEIKITRDGLHDPIFSGIPDSFFAKLSHRCMIKKVPYGWKLLGSSSLCKIQALAVGPSIRLVQFHPEMDVHQIRMIATLQKEYLIEEKFVENEKEFSRLLRSIKNTNKTGKQILHNFIEHFVLPYHQCRVER